MRIHAQASRQRGAVLLVVLVFSIMATLLVVTNLKDNLVQELLAGNFQNSSTPVTPPNKACTRATTALRPG